MTTYKETLGFNHSIEEHRLPIILEAMFWFHCKTYFPNHDTRREFSKHLEACTDFWSTPENGTQSTTWSDDLIRDTLLNGQPRGYFVPYQEPYHYRLNP